MPNLQNGSKGDSNPGSLDCESGILPLSYGAPYKLRFFFHTYYKIFSNTQISTLILCFLSHPGTINRHNNHPPGPQTSRHGVAASLGRVRPPPSRSSSSAGSCRQPYGI